MELGKRAYRFIRDFVVFIPGENPSPMSLCGTNCYVIGRGCNRTLIEAGDYPGQNEKFLSHLTQFLDDHMDVRLRQILITHGHHDHFGGLHSVLQLLKSRGQTDVQAFKMMTDNCYEREILEAFPGLEANVKTIENGQYFDTFDPHLSLRAIHTPGHLDDHMSFALTSSHPNEKLLISGDIILGTPSAIIDDLDIYLQNLKALQAMNFDNILLPHSVGDQTEQIIVDAKTKLQDYITYRESRLAELVGCFKPGTKVARADLFDRLYGSRGLNETLTIAAYRNLDLQLDKLIKDGTIASDTEGFFTLLIKNFKL